MATEFELYGPILRALSMEGARAFRNHVALTKSLDDDGEQRMARAGLATGSHDLIGLCPDGLFLSIEVKPPGWRPTPSWRTSKTGKAQIAWRDMVRHLGGRTGFARSIEEALDILRGGPGFPV